jgi:hypothetical protein
MRRWGKWGLIALPWLLLMVLVWDQLRSIDFFALDASTDAHFDARQGFMADLAYHGCVPRAAIIAEAEERDWLWQDLDDFPYCHAPTGLTDWLHVDVSPPLPFSTEGENAAYFGFDATGCMIEWTYASCTQD